MKQACLSKIIVMAAIGAVASPPLQSAEKRHLTLTEAVHLAISQNRALKIARLKVIKNEQKKTGQRSAYFPTITNQSNALHLTELPFVAIPAGAFGQVAGTPVPPRSEVLS